MKTLTYRPFASFAGQLQGTEVSKAAEILNEHASVDATVEQAEAAKQQKLNEAYRQRLAEAAELRGDKVVNDLLGYIGELLDSQVRHDEDGDFGVPGIRLKDVHNKQGSVTVLLVSDSGERRELTIKIS